MTRIEPVTGRTVEYHQIRRGLWVASASHPDYQPGAYASNERDIRRSVRAIEASLRAEHEEVKRVWPQVEAQLNAIFSPQPLNELKEGESA